MQSDAIKGLRELADFLEANPAFPDLGYNSLHTFVDTAEEIVEATKALGHADKAADNYYYEVSRNFGPFKLTVNIVREKICQRVQVGTKRIPAQIIPPQVELFVAAHEEPIYEYRCPDSILGLTNEQKEAHASGE